MDLFNLLFFIWGEGVCRMRAVTHTDMTIVAGLVGLMIAVMFFLHIPVRPQAVLYPIVRQATRAKINYETRDLAVTETEHFTIKYAPADADMVPMVAEAAEDAYDPVVSAMGSAPHDKTLIVIYHDKTELRKVFGWSGDESAMGAYWGGAIQLLSPRAWMQDGQSTADFIHSGPMVHEFTHLVFDYMTNGNYPRWFTEGLAQYVEYKVNHYEWITPGNRLDGTLYTAEELEQDFDNLPNQSLAYRESLAAVRYIAEVHGESSLRQVISALQSGRPIDQAITQATGMSYADFDKAWRAWAVTHMENEPEE